MSAFAGLNPGSSLRRAATVRSIRPLPTNSTIDRAISAITRARRRAPARPVPTASCGLSVASPRSRAPMSDGTVPKTTAATPTTPNVKASAVTSTPILPTRGRSGPYRRSSGTAQSASNSPPTPPAAASTPLSVMSCRTSRPLPAPRATRNAISRRRLTTRARFKLAMFTHAIRRTNPTAANSASSSDRRWATTLSRNGIASMRMPSSRYGAKFSRCCAAITSSSACARSRLTPGRTRARTAPVLSLSWSRRPSTRLNRSSGTRIGVQASTSCARPVPAGIGTSNPRGMTPTTIAG